MTRLRTAALTALVLLVVAAAASAAPRKQPPAPNPTQTQQVFPGLGRTPNPNHALRRQVAPEALLRTTVALMGGTDLATLPRHVRTALSKAVGKPVRALRQPKTQAALLASLRKKLGDDRFEEIVGNHAVGVKRAAQQLDNSWGPQDDKDMQRGWGFQLLPKNDQAFKEPRFLARLMRESDQTGDGMVHHAPTQAKYQFDSAWGKVAPNNVRPISFTLTGSDANNLLYSVALKAARRRLGDQVNDAEILYFDGVYGGGRGRIGGTSFLPYGKRGAPNLDHLKVTSPHSYYFKPTSKQEIARLKQKEDQALAEIEKKVTEAKVPIGGILMEPILGAKGVMFYRPEFLTKLRALCDKLKVPILADEILTGGGRTGKFFGYQHYDGFEPDFVTFGKGLQVAGIAQVSRRPPPASTERPPSYEGPDTMTTLGASNESLLKAAQVMNRIHDGKLMENATRVGQHMLRKLQAYDRPEQNSQTPDQDPPHGMVGGPTRGLGLLLYTKHYTQVMGGMGRLMPYLSLTTQEVDRLFTKKTVRQSSY